MRAKLLQEAKEMTEQIRPVPMATYRFFDVNHLDEVLAVRWIDCPDDVVARKVASSLITERSGIEVWDVGRRVCKMPAC